jgi:Ca2+-dependent lipid-binding protein
MIGVPTGSHFAITETSDPFFTIEVNNKAIFQSDEYDKNLNPSLTKEPILGVLMSVKELDTLKIVVADFQNIGTVNSGKPFGVTLL